MDKYEEILNDNVLRTIMLWFEIYQAKLDVSFGDFYRANIDQMLDIGPEYGVSYEYMLLLAQAYGYYKLLLQFPAVKAVNRQLAARGAHVPKEPFSVLDVQSDLKFWLGLYGSKIDGAKDPEIVKIFHDNLPKPPAGRTEYHQTI
jgi:hypothetical protein